MEEEEGNSEDENDIESRCKDYGDNDDEEDDNSNENEDGKDVAIIRGPEIVYKEEKYGVTTNLQSVMSKAEEPPTAKPELPPADPELQDHSIIALGQHHILI